MMQILSKSSISIFSIHDFFFICGGRIPLIFNLCAFDLLNGWKRSEISENPRNVLVKNPGKIIWLPKVFQEPATDKKIKK
jgi:hypothetical protein